MEARTFRDLRALVVAHGGFMEVAMEDLRDLVGAGKLGVHVRDEIRAGLRRVQLRVLGDRLPSDQRVNVWLIARGTEGGQLLEECLEFIELDRQTRPAATHRSAA